MIIGFHLTWTTYGHWFPNDPRGSWSEELWKPQLSELRPLDDGRKVTHPRPVSKGALQEFLDRARKTLEHEAVWLTTAEIEAVGKAFSEVAAKTECVVRACAIMPNHVHLAIERHPDSYERLMNRFKGRSAQRVRERLGIAVAAARGDRIPIWTQGYWSRYIDRDADMDRVVEYVRSNPAREELPVQEWGFVKR